MTRLERERNIYRGRDPRDLPLYTPAEAALFLHLPESTVRAWSFGQRGFRAVLDVPTSHGRMLSFKNLVEVHVLAILRREKRVSLTDVRAALVELKQKLGEKQPLLSRKLLADGNRRVFVEIFGKLVNVTEDGQVEMREVVDQYLARIDRDSHGIPIKLFPFTTSNATEAGKAVEIDPRVQFGKPVLTGTRIMTTVLAERIKAGDTLDVLAKDYGRPKEDIEAALRYHIAA